MPKPTDKCQVYYLSDQSCTDPFTQGYVGLTAQRRSRLRFRLSGRFPADFKVTILYEGNASRVRCRGKEIWTESWCRLEYSTRQRASA